MCVSLVILFVTIQSVFSRNAYHWKTSYSYNWQPAWNHRAHRSLQPTVYFPNINVQPNRHFAQNPQIHSNQITVQTGFHGSRPTNVYTIPLNWNGQHQKQFGQVSWPNSFMNQNNHGFHQIQLPINQQFQAPNVMTGHITVENLNGKFENFVKPDLNQMRPTASFTPNIRPQYNQGGAFVHGHPTLSHWSPPGMATQDTSLPDTSYNNMQHFGSTPSASVPHQFTTTSSPVPVTQPATNTSPADQQENNSSNEDESPVIDVRIGGK